VAAWLGRTLKGVQVWVVQPGGWRLLSTAHQQSGNPCYLTGGSRQGVGASTAGVCAGVLVVLFSIGAAVSCTVMCQLCKACLHVHATWAVSMTCKLWQQTSFSARLCGSCMQMQRLMT
jgi:hypothetical protein